MTRERLRIVQALLEGLIPLLGFFLWDWTLHFVLLFYMLDLFADHVFLHLGARRITSEQKLQHIGFIKQGVLALLLLSCALLLMHLALIHVFPDIELWESTINFWSYTELGIEQGYLLLPLVFLAAQQQYKMDFILPARYRNRTLSEHWKKAMLSYSLIGAFSGIVIGLEFFVDIPVLFYLISIVVISTAFRLLFS